MLNDKINDKANTLKIKEIKDSCYNEIANLKTHLNRSMRENNKIDDLKEFEQLILDKANEHNKINMEQSFNKKVLFNLKMNDYKQN